MRNMTALVGNGLSVAFNDELLLARITAEVRDRISASRDDGQDVVEALKEFADTHLPADGMSDDDFETLVGALGTEQRALEALDVLARLTEDDPGEITTAIRAVRKFATDFRDVGTAHVLEVIYGRSRSDFVRSEPLKALLTSIYSAFADEVTFGNLNYDTLLLSAMLQAGEAFVDLGNGMEPCEIGAEKLSGHAIRATIDDFPDRDYRRVQLLHLHGSLTYWRTVDGSQICKLSREDVAKHGLFEKVRSRTTDLRPVVVLNRERQKVEDIKAHPFKLAYEALGRAIQHSDHWLIIGYSFRDVAVNDLLQSDFLARDDKPTVLVVTHGESLTEEAVLSALGWGAEDGAPTWLHIDRAGADDVQERPSWQWFVNVP